MPGAASPPLFPEEIDFTQTPTLAFGPDEFVHFLADEDWTDEQKREYAGAMWSVVMNLLDWNFRFHPVQEAIEAAKRLEAEAPK